MECDLENRDCLVVVVHDHKVNWRGLHSILGLAVVLDKPIVLALKAGVPIPDKVARVVDRFVEWHDDQSKMQLALGVAMQILGIGDVLCQCNFCQQVRAEAWNENTD